MSEEQTRIAPPYDDSPRERGLRFVESKFQPSAADLEELTGPVESGVPRVVVDQAFPLEHALPAGTCGQGPRTQRDRPRDGVSL